MSDDFDTVPNILYKAADTFMERGKVYGCAYKNFNGKILTALFPNGVVLKTELDFNRYAALNAIAAKLGRYCNNWENGGHKDSVHDIINFAAMLEEFCDEDC